MGSGIPQTKRGRLKYRYFDRISLELVDIMKTRIIACFQEGKLKVENAWNFGEGLSYCVGILRNIFFFFFMKVVKIKETKLKIHKSLLNNLHFNEK